VILPGGNVKRAKIIDFGIARTSRVGEGTVIGSGFAGKFSYVSPEQLGLFGGEVGRNPTCTAWASSLPRRCWASPSTWAAAKSR
jgi:serine/threonine protein kinase